MRFHSRRKKGLMQGKMFVQSKSKAQVRWKFKWMALDGGNEAEKNNKVEISSIFVQRRREFPHALFSSPHFTVGKENRWENPFPCCVQNCSLGRMIVITLLLASTFDFLSPLASIWQTTKMLERKKNIHRKQIERKLDANNDEISRASVISVESRDSWHLKWLKS